MGYIFDTEGLCSSGSLFSCLICVSWIGRCSFYGTMISGKTRKGESVYDMGSLELKIDKFYWAYDLSDRFWNL